MANKDSSTQDKAKPVEQTTQTDEQKSEHKADVSAPPSIGKPPDGENKEPQPAQAEDETDRKQDETLDSIADQTKWIARQTRWLIAQVIVSSFLTALTLGVLIYHGIMMGRQWEAMGKQSELMNTSTEQAKRAHIDQNRAYVAVKRIHLKNTIQSGKPVEVLIVFENSGQTPARNVLEQVNYGPLPIATDFSWMTQMPLIEPKKSSLAIIPARGEYEGRKPLQASKEDVALIKGDVRLHIFGYIQYLDIWGNARRTMFCYYNESLESLDFTVCPKNNVLE